MDDMTFNLTDTEKALQSALYARRTQGYGGKPGIVRKRDSSDLGYRTADAGRGGSVYSPYARFDGSMMVEWGVRVLNHLSEEIVPMPKMPYLVRCDGWDEAKVEINRIFDEKFEADRAEAQTALDEDGLESFLDWNSHSVVEDGKVTCAWDADTYALCRYWLDNMTQFTVFTVWQVVSDAVSDSVAESIGAWADGSKDDHPGKVAEKAMSAAMQNLSDLAEEAG